MKSSNDIFLNFYSAHYNSIDTNRIRIKSLIAGMFAVAFVDKFYRVEVVYVSDDDVLVSYVDYGIRGILKKCQMLYLSKSFSNISRKCIKASLFGVMPEQGDKIWSVKTMEMFKKKTLKVKTYAKVKACKDSVYSLALYDISMRENFKNFLVDEKFAEISDEVEEHKNGILVSFSIYVKKEIYPNL